MVKLLKLLLYPFASLYNLGTRFRNHLFDIGQKPSFTFDRVIISVGNLNVGGSGKTPMVEYLIQLLASRYAVATLSRGYKRTTSGYRLAHQEDTALTIGDEPFQLYRKFKGRIKVVVGEDRVFAIPHILQDFPETKVIILDDAFQHRSVKPQLTVLVTEFSNPFYKDFVLPFGRLRESRSGARRADVVVVTKCNPNLSEDERTRMGSAILRYAGEKPVFFSSIQYGIPRSFGSSGQLSKNVILVSGIARSASLRDFCDTHYSLLKHFEFPDHHLYTRQDLEMIEEFFKSQIQPASIITTEKDWARLSEPGLRPYCDRLPWFYVPIQQEFTEDGLKFDELVLSVIAKSTN
jgi:tetraacyldisaccharide 4'-kinase